jgi:hypothetical protein
VAEVLIIHTHSTIFIWVCGQDQIHSNPPRILLTTVKSSWLFSCLFNDAVRNETVERQMKEWFFNNIVTWLWLSD